MHAMWVTALYEFKKYIRNRSLLLLMIGLPLLLIFILGSALDIQIKPAKVALYLEDQGELAEGIGSFWDDPALTPYVMPMKEDSQQQVESLVKAGKADYGVVVPAHFSEEVIAGQSAEWIVFPGRNADKNMAAEAVIDHYMTDANLELAKLALAGAASVSAKHEPDNPAVGEGVGEGADSYVKVGTLSAGSNQIFDSVSAVQYYAAAYLIMFLLYNGMIAADAVLDQRREGTLQRLYAVPVSFRGIIAGIICGAFMLSIFQAAAILLFTTYVYGVDWGGSFGLIGLICLLTIVASMGFAFFITSFKLSRKTVNSIFTFAVFSMTFMSGGMMAGVGSLLGGADRFTLNYWSNASLRSIMNGSDTDTVIGQIIVLAIIAFVLVLLAAVRLPKVVKYNG